MENGTRTGGGVARWLIVGGFALLGVIVIGGAAVSARQADIHSSKTAEIESRAATVALLEDVQEESGIAGTLLQQYVAEGDDALIPQIQSHSDAARGSLLEAAAESDSAAIAEASLSGAGLAEGAAQIIGLRLTGDVEGAAAALEGVAPAFEEFNLAFAGITEQLQDVGALQSSADSANDRAQSSLIVAVAAGATLGFVTLALIARSVMRRRAARSAVPA
jgi:hypothetical protein